MLFNLSKLFLTKISIFWANFGSFDPHFYLLSRISIFDDNFDLFTKILICWPNFQFWPNFVFSSKFWSFVHSFYFLTKILIFVPKFQFFDPKVRCFDQNSDFVTKIFYILLKCRLFDQNFDCLTKSWISWPIFRSWLLSLNIPNTLHKNLNLRQRNQKLLNL